MLLSQLQREHERWLAYNFPDQHPHDALLGLVEEVGELAHAHLKHEQGIRGMTDEEFKKQAGDAIGDIVIYLASYCNTNDFNLPYEVSTAWDKVKERDWRKDPDNAGA